MPQAAPPKQITVPETFILESLSLEDEATERRDGRLLFEQLRMQGMNPRYYYFRTEKELRRLAVEYRNSGYRYLHLSCHGSDAALQFTFDSISFSTFADIFEKRIDNRRLFISGCSLGNRSFADTVYSKNGGMYSIIAPFTAIRFDQATVFWPSFYFLMHSYDRAGMRATQLRDALGHLSTLFEVSVAHYRKVENRVIEKRFSAPVVPLLWDSAKGVAPTTDVSRGRTGA